MNTLFTNMVIYSLISILFGLCGCAGDSSETPPVSDTTSQDRISDLLLTGCSNNSCTLTWTAIDDDNPGGPPVSYIIRYSTSEISSENFEDAQIATNTMYPKTTGSKEEFSIGDLNDETTYYFAVKVNYEYSNTSDLSNMVSGTTVADGAQLINPSDLEYLGAFRLPNSSNGVSWNFAGGAYYGGGDMTYYPEGDPNGPADGYPGSIYGIGKYSDDIRISEFNIPTPVISQSKDVQDLNTAETLQGFQDIRSFDLTGNTSAIGSVEYLPVQGSQETGKLYYSWAEYFQFSGGYLSQSWSELNLSNPQIQGGWYLGDGLIPHNMSVGGYMFAIPKNWADIHTPGKYLITGRYSTLSFGAGPSMHAYGPWNEGNPPPRETQLKYTTLLQYGNNSNQLNDYTPEDRWYGGAWLTSDNNSAVIIAGVKALGNVWYGYSDGTLETDCMHSSPPGLIDCSDKGQRGWKADDYEGRIMFYNPDDLADVVNGNIQPYTPQPFAILDVDDYLYHGSDDDYEQHRLGGVSFDRANGKLYIFELFGDGDKPLIHAWQL